MTVLRTILGVIVVLIVAVLLFIYSGAVDVAADKPHMKATQWLLQTARTQAIDMRATKVSVTADLNDMQRIRRGAKEYGEMCQACHLGPGVKPTPVHEGLNPTPPKLAMEAGDIPPAHLFWIVKHGIKMTGMPAWGESHPDDEIWDIVAFVKHLPDMTPQQYQQLTGRTEKATDVAAAKVME